ncbi:MAG: diguanylate cyclase [Poseidonibacter sp.]|uniref:GGDEF domain-containing response regulator n=1 Tax=Poseidonibacter sp. TaxID=2321188 RepID=UPI00359DD161
MSITSILYIEDNLEIQKDYYNILTKQKYKVFVPNNKDDILSLYKEVSPDIVITDISSFGFNDFELIHKIKIINPNQTIIITTNQQESKYLLKAFDIGIDSYLLKPIKKESLLNKIHQIYEKKFAIKQKYKLLDSILQNKSALVFLTDFEKITYASKSFLDFFNIDKIDDFFYRFESILDMFINNERYLYAKTKDDFLNKFQNSNAIDKMVLMLGKDFNPKAYHVHIDKIQAQDDLYIISLTNISIIQQRNIEISHKAYVDGLTQISNRNKFEEIFSYEFDKFKRYKTNFSIAILDIDHFKKVNDTFGHLYGDEILIMLANKIDNSVRKTDLFARWGGEEFVLLMPNTNLENAKILTENLRVIVQNEKHEVVGNVTSSFGITTIKQNDTLESIFQRCDKALYNAKRNGRNKVEVL